MIRPMNHQPRHVHHKKPKKGFDWMIVFLVLMIVAAVTVVYLFGTLDSARLGY